MRYRVDRKIRHLINKVLPNPIRQGTRSYAFLYTPILAIILFTGAMGLILWTLNYQDKAQQEYTLYRESAYAKQRIQLRFNTNEEILLELSRNISNSVNQMRYPDSFLKGSTKLIQDSPEILHLRWINAERNRLWSMPERNHHEWHEKPNIKTVLDQDLSALYFDAAETNRPVYGRIIQLDLDQNDSRNKDRQNVFWHITPIIQNGNMIGALAALYSVNGVIRNMIPSDLNGLYRFTLLDNTGKELAISNSKKTAARSLEHDVLIDRPATPLTLHVSTYPPPTNLTYRTLLWLVIGLSTFVLWSLWSVWQQTKQRLLIQKDLQTETNFRRAMEAALTIGMRAHDLEGRITYVNPALCKMTGWSSEELIGLMPPFPFWPKEQTTQFKEKLAAAITGNAPKTGIEAILEKRDGSRINTRTFVSPLIDEKGNQTGWMSAIVDISEPIKARQQLALAQERFTTVLESLDAAVSVISLQSGQQLFANKYYRDNFGSTTEAHLDLAGHEIEPGEIDDLNIDHTDGFAGLPASELTPGHSDSREIQLSKYKKWFEVRRRYISWVDGHLAQLIVATDITDRRMTQELARQQEEKMQFSSRLTTMGEMASSLAHELNQPLAAISNYCTGIANRLRVQKDIDIEKDILPAIEKATAQAHRAGTIIQRIRGFVKRSQPQSKIVDIHSIIDDAIGLAEIEAQRYGLQIALTVAENLPKIFADPVLIQQVLINLLKNAVDSVKSRPDENSSKFIELKVDIPQESYPEMLRIQVIDSGLGISEDAINRLYEPFFSTKTDGMGMGLNICRSIIESHHGRLWAENNSTEKDQSKPGCTFTILLPLDK